MAASGFGCQCMSSRLCWEGDTVGRRRSDFGDEFRTLIAAWNAYVAEGWKHCVCRILSRKRRALSHKKGTWPALPSKRPSPCTKSRVARTGLGCHHIQGGFCSIGDVQDYVGCDLMPVGEWLRCHEEEMGPISSTSRAINDMSFGWIHSRL